MILCQPFRGFLVTQPEDPIAAQELHVIETHTPQKQQKSESPPMLSDSSQMVTYTTLWSPIGYMENAINHDCRGAGAVPAVFQQGGQRGRKHHPEEGPLLGKETRSL